MRLSRAINIARLHGSTFSKLPIIPMMILACLQISSDTCFASPQKPIVIGGIFDLSSEAARLWGNAEKNGVTLAIEDFQKIHPEVQVSLKIEDSQYSNTQAVSAFHKLTSVDGVRFIIGPTWETFVSIMPLCESKQIICMAPSHNGFQFHNPLRSYSFSFSAWFDERGYSDVVVEDINNKGFKKVAVIGAISAYHDTLIDYLLSKLKNKPQFVERVSIESVDFRSTITKINPDVDAVVMFLTGDGPVTNFLKQWHQLKKGKPGFYGDDNFLYLTPASVQMLRKLGLNIQYSAPHIPEEANIEWNAHYAARFGSIPEAPSSAVAYDETTLLLACSLSGADDLKVKECIKTTKSFKGKSGELSFDGKQSVTTRTFNLETFGISYRNRRRQPQMTDYKFETKIIALLILPLFFYFASGKKFRHSIMTKEPLDRP